MDNLPATAIHDQLEISREDEDWQGEAASYFDLTINLAATEKSFVGRQTEGDEEGGFESLYLDLELVAEIDRKESKIIVANGPDEVVRHMVSKKSRITIYPSIPSLALVEKIHPIPHIRLFLHEDVSLRETKEIEGESGVEVTGITECSISLVLPLDLYDSILAKVKLGQSKRMSMRGPLTWIDSSSRRKSGWWCEHFRVEMQFGSLEVLRSPE